jgi:hypothetical protein
MCAVGMRDKHGTHALTTPTGRNREEVCSLVRITSLDEHSSNPQAFETHKEETT